MVQNIYICFCFVCFITKSFLTYSFFPPTPALSTISRPLSSSMFSITPATANVCSSYNRMRGPGIGCWFSDRSNCSHLSFEAVVLPINPNIYTDQCTTLLLFILFPSALHGSPDIMHEKVIQHTEKVTYRFGHVKIVINSVDTFGFVTNI